MKKFKRSVKDAPLLIEITNNDGEVVSTMLKSLDFLKFEFIIASFYKKYLECGCEPEKIEEDVL